MKRIENVTIDVKDCQYDEIRLKQMDTTQLIFNILDNSKQINLEGLSSNIIFTKPNGSIVIQNSTIDATNKKVIVDLMADCVRDYGKGKIEVELKNGEEILSSFQLLVQIERTSKENIHSDNTPNYIEYMDKAIKKLQEDSEELIEDITEEKEEVLADVENRTDEFIESATTEKNTVIGELQRKASEILTEYNNLVAEVRTVLSNVLNRGHIYGIKRKITDLSGNKNTSTLWTKLYDNANLVAEAQKGSDSNVRNDYDNIYPWNKIITLNYDAAVKKVKAFYGDNAFKFDGTNGEVMDRYPRFWIKRLFPVQEEDGYYEYRFIADFELQDFIKIEQFEIGRYEMYVDENNIGHSYSGVYPKYNTNIKQFTQYAKNTGEEFCIEDWRYFAIETLYLVEYADNNSQNTLGRGVSEWSEKKAIVAETNVNRIIVDNASAFPVGRSICIGTTAAWNGGVAVNRTITSIEPYTNETVTGYAIYFDGDPVNIAIGNDIWGSAQKTGDCDSLGMKSGCLVNDGRHSVIYRGKENPFANLFEFKAGINIKDYQTYVNYDPSTYAPDTFNDDYSQLSYANPNNAEGYIKVLGYDKNNPLIALPTELGASASTGYADYCYSKNAGNRVARVGGYFNYGAVCGFFSWSFSNDSSSSAWHIGARLLKYQ